MDAIETVLLILLVADAIALTVLVLVQQGKGAEVGAAFGSGAANTIFGSAGANSFMTKLTVWLAIGFFVITFGLAYTAKQRAGNVEIEGLPQLPAETASEDLPIVEEKSDSGLTEDAQGVDSRVPEV